MEGKFAEYRDLYFGEAHQQLARIGDALHDLERARADRVALENAFRAAHTIKGMSSTMGYEEAVASAHALEDLLQAVRQRPGGASASNLFFLFRALNQLGQVISRLEADTPAQIGPPSGAHSTTGETMGPPASGVIQVTTEQLDQLNLLVLQLVAHAPPVNGDQSSSGGEARSDFQQYLRALQDAVWRLRMVPIGDLFRLYPRMLDEQARRQGKEVRVLLEGESIEIGRGLAEEINEPLLHLLRNAVVHGIEPLAERMKAGKDPRGTIEMRARLEGNWVVVQVADDGRGLNAEAILAAAHAQGFISAEDRDALTEDEAFKLITLPGFSLSQMVTPLAGRGVGMDVVQAKVEALHGSLTIHSEQGHGTTFTMRLPRTFGPMEVELVRCGDGVVAVPAGQIESHRRYIGDGLEELDGVPLLDLRELLPSVANHAAPGADRVLILLNQPRVAVLADGLLGRALWKAPGPDQQAPIPLLDLDRLLLSALNHATDDYSQARG